MRYNLTLNYVNVQDTIFSDTGERKISIISGTNNSGKTVLLKYLFEKFGDDAYFCATNRHYQVEYLPVYSDDPQQFKNRHNNALKQIKDLRFNQDNNIIPFQEIITSLNDIQRNNLFKICSRLIGEEFKLDFASPGNSMSQTYLSVGGKNLSKSSTGTRMLAYLLALLLYNKYSYLLIDEPELGLTPKIQFALKEFLTNDSHYPTYMPHLKHIFIATHSHIFLNEKRIDDNYLITKNDNQINLSVISNILEFHNLQFNQLGNSFELLHMPNGFIIVEGQTDYKFLNRLLNLKFQNKKINIIQANGDGQVKTKLYGLFEILGNIQISPYLNKILVVLDHVHSPTLNNDLERIGMPSEQIIEWSENGIEYYYPPEIVSNLFKCDPTMTQKIKIVEDKIELNGIRKTKNELCEQVINSMTGSETYSDELEDKLLNKIHEF